MVENNTKTNGTGRSSLLTKEDWWAVWIGLGIIIVALIMYAAGSSIKVINVSFEKWGDLAELGTTITGIFPKIIILYAILAAVFTGAMTVMGRNPGKFLAGFTVLFIMAVFIQILGAYKEMSRLSLEAPVLALVLGMVLGNIIKIPDWFQEGMRTEFYVKTGIVLLGATLPFTLILQSGPVAFLQATLVAVATFVTIYFVGAHVLKLEKPFAATLGAGGSICGVSASIAIGSSVNAKKEHVSIAISMVVIWATVMVFLLPIICRALGLSDGAAGAWIGTSEFADAAGIAAAAQFGDGATTTFTLMKVVGRDIFVGIWAFILSIIAVTMWEAKKDANAEGAAQKPSAGVIWERFPKFVLGFFVASILITIVSILGAGEFADNLKSQVLSPVGGGGGLRGWAFTLCFLCIGLTTRFRELTATGSKPFLAFTAGVAVNVILGFLLSTVFLNEYWTQIGM